MQDYVAELALRREPGATILYNLGVIDARQPARLRQALDDGESPKAVWRAVWETLGLPARQR